MSLESRRPPPDPDLFARLKWILFFRLIIVSILFLSIIGFHLRESRAFLIPNLIILYFAIGFSYFFTLLSLLALFKIKRLKLLSYLQASWEVLFATALIYITGIWDSLFGFLYILAIIVASILLSGKGAFFSAVWCSIFYGLQIFGIKYGWIPAFFPPESELPTIDLIRSFFYYLCFFYATAAGAGYITEQLRKTSQELTEARIGLDRLEVLNEAIVHSIRSGLITFDAGGTIIFLNRASEEIFGKKARELIGKTLSDLFDPAGRDKLAEAREKETRMKLPYTNFQDQKFTLECFWQKLQNPAEQSLGELLVIADITELEKMEERLRVADRLAAVGKLAAGIAHEIRNPLAAISGSIELLKKEITPASSDAHLMGIVLSETERLDQLITDFLLYARPTPKTIERIKIDGLLKNLILILKTQVNNVELVLETEPEMIINSDPGLIEQIFWNLVNNALEAMPGGGKLVIQGGKEIRDSKSGIWLLFSDTGVGVPADCLYRIFDPFFTTKDYGTGLGLSTTWRIIEELKGEIQVSSQPGKGSSFRIWLPGEYIPGTKGGPG